MGRQSARMSLSLLHFHRLMPSQSSLVHRSVKGSRVRSGKISFVDVSMLWQRGKKEKKVVQVMQSSCLMFRIICQTVRCVRSIQSTRVEAKRYVRCMDELVTFNRWVNRMTVEHLPAINIRLLDHLCVKSIDSHAVFVGIPDIRIPYLQLRSL